MIVSENIDSLEKLERLIQPYDTVKLEQLKQELMLLPGKRKVRIWKGHHLDDRDILEICRQCNLEVYFEEMHFADIDEAAIYICRRQLQRSDISSEYKKYLIGEMYSYEQANRLDFRNNDSKSAIAFKIATELYISAGTVQKYYQYSTALNNIFDQDMEFAKKILSGKLRISHENILELARLKPEEISAVAKSSSEEKVEHLTWSFIKNEIKWSNTQYRTHSSRKERSGDKSLNKINIRQMPEYDPDSEVNSLCMTMDSWISSIQRVKSSENFPKISHIASLRLMKKLSILENTINIVQESLVERTQD